MNTYALNYVYVDIETGGLSPQSSDVVSIAIIDGYGEMHYTKVKPLLPVEPKAASVNGYNEADWADAPTLQQVSKTICKLLYGKQIIGYNVSFDTDYLRTRLSKLCITHVVGYKNIDVLSFTRAAFPELNNHRLETVASHMGFKFAAHNAAEDIKVTKKIYDLLRPKGPHC